MADDSTTTSWTPTQIPTPTAPEQEPTLAVYPFRWEGHGVDVRILVRDGEAVYVAHDILAALEQDTDHLRRDAGASRAATRSDLARARTIDSAELSTIAEALGTADAAALLAWASSRGRDSIAIENARRGPAGRPTVVVGPWSPAVSLPAQTEDPWFSVGQAAQILSRDPSITIGQKRLFERMHELGWIDRPGTSWEPVREITVIGYLRTVGRRIPGRARGDIYPQLAITPRGLQALHERLGGTSTLDLTRHHLTLTEEGPDGTD